MMKKHITLALSIAALLGIIGCDDDSKEPACKTEGYVSCGGTCIDPKTSNAYCGANEYCENFVACKETETCFNGRCRPTNCEPDEHHYDVVCEKDSADNCGEHGVKCADKVEGWKSGTCVDKTCIPDACTAGLHPFEKGCEADDAKHCGSHDTACSNEISGWSDGTCEGGKCRVSACQAGLHPYTDACESDDADNCGAHGTSCSLTVNGWTDGDCIQSTCTVKSCAENMHVYENACELDDVENCGLHGRACATTVAGWKSGACAQGACKILQCIDGFHVDAGTGECVQDTSACCGAACTKCADGLVCAGGECRTQCKDTEAYCNHECTNIEASTTNCGECGHDCNAEMPENAQTMICSDSACVLTACKDNYHIADKACVPDTETACGKEATDCTAKEWWDSGSCKAGKCIPSACKGDYYLAQNNSDENKCEPNNDLNCGSQGNACAGSQQCAGGRCLGNTICNDVLRNTLTDLDHCGECNHKCSDGLICDKGQCKKGNGQAYCSGNKVTMGTIDRCSSCSDKCSDSLICKDNACVAGAGMTYCSGNTINTLNDIDHCGSCNHKCANGQICSEGTCKAGNGVMYCNGVKINSTQDSAHCSGCGNLCPAGSKCGMTSSLVACNEGVGSTYCSGIERNTSIDSANCGQCGKKCVVGQICQSGTCQTGTGATICDGKSINTSTDSAHCGQCGNKCAVGKICQSGTCQTGTGVTYCDGKSVNISNDFANCGQCGRTTAHKICKDGGFIDPSVGGTVSFGNYNSSPIEWYILDNDTVNHRLMLLAMDVLEERAYHTKSEVITWEQSTIRSWLNGYGSSENKQSKDYTSSNFMKSAFTDEEKAKIPKVTVVNDDNPQYNTPGGNNTQDYVFLLSINEVKTLLPLYVDSQNNMCTKIYCTAHWWLRSPGYLTILAALVDRNGDLATYGTDVDGSTIGVRPALWLNH